MKSPKLILSIIILLTSTSIDDVMGQWAANGNNIYNTNSGYVGIGNNSPSTLLYVAKNMTEPNITVRNMGGAGGATFTMVDDASAANWKFKATSIGGFKIRDHAFGLDVIVIEPNSSANAIYIKAGKIGMGTSSPSVKLDVRGDNPDWGAGLLLGNSDLSHSLKFFPGRQSDPNAMIQWKEGDPLRFGTDAGEEPEKMRITSEGQVGIGTATPASSALVEMASTSKGFLPPRMTQSQIGYISGPADGMLVYCTTDSKFYIFVATANTWKEILYGTGTISAFFCGSPITKNHVAGNVAPVSKTVSYGTVTNVPGEPSKCWITSNLGADHQAASVDDATEASAGWYWQFNRMQGYKHDGVNRTPNTTWISQINENLNWSPDQDPCTLELGSDWRLPTPAEWTNVDASGGWTDWNGTWSSSLKIHAAGVLGYSAGVLYFRGSTGEYWSNSQSTNTWGSILYLDNANSDVSTMMKAQALSARCLRNL